LIWHCSTSDLPFALKEKYRDELDQKYGIRIYDQMLFCPAATELEPKRPIRLSELAANLPETFQSVDSITGQIQPPFE
jgi:hypothetical protein